MVIELPDAVFANSGYSVEDIRLEFAVYLFQSGKVSFGQARRITGLDVISFQQKLAARRIPLNDDIEGFEDDLKKDL